jgi:ribosome-associated translation inhibitor RaiA
MMIQFNTDKAVSGAERHKEFFSAQITEELKIYEDDITRIEVHLSDENGNKEGINDIRCLLEARLEGKHPIAVSSKANNVEQAVSGAVIKLKTTLNTILGRLNTH